MTRDGEPIDLTPTEYRLLELLMSRPDVVWGQEQLVMAIWGLEYAEDTGYIRRYVWHLTWASETLRVCPRLASDGRLALTRGTGAC